MTNDVTWQTICPLAAIVPWTGVAAKIGAQQVAIFRYGDELFAIDNYDPFSGANVLARGLVGDRAGIPKVASPIYKQNFDLRTGQCLDDDSVQVQTWPVQVDEGGMVVVGVVGVVG